MDLTDMADYNLTKKMKREKHKDKQSYFKLYILDIYEYIVTSLLHFGDQK